MTTNGNQYLYAADLAELRDKGYLTRQLGGQTMAIFYHNDTVYAIDNRCPHMGFPLDRGTVKDGILTCHWHYARFDLASGGTFDQWADDVPKFPVEIREGLNNHREVWVDPAPSHDKVAHQRDRLLVGLERDIPLVIGKAVLTLNDADPALLEPFRVGVEFGTRYRSAGWGQGLTMLTCFMNMLPALEREDRPRALYLGLSAVARDSAGMAPRFGVRPLPGDTPAPEVLKRWFRQFIEVRDDEGAERCIVSALVAGATPRQVADMLFSGVTDHRYIQIGHPADFTNKALEALDIAGWERAEPVLTSLVSGYAGASRMEESNSWRYPVDLIEILDHAFERIPQDIGSPERSSARKDIPWSEREKLALLLLEDNPQAGADALLDTLLEGWDVVDLAGVVAYSAGLRIARFHTSNEFGDWDTALHTFTFANAVHQGLRRAPSPELTRGIFDAAMSVYLDRFLNLPAAPIPTPNGTNGSNGSGEQLLSDLAASLDRQQQVNPAGKIVARYTGTDDSPQKLLATLGKLLLREDRDFHTIQCVESALRQYSLLEDETARRNILVAATRYLAAHSPTVRSQGQTYQIATRLHRGERLFEGD